MLLGEEQSVLRLLTALAARVEKLKSEISSRVRDLHSQSLEKLISYCKSQCFQTLDYMPCKVIDSKMEFKNF